MSQAVETIYQSFVRIYVRREVFDVVEEIEARRFEVASVRTFVLEHSDH